MCLGWGTYCWDNRILTILTMSPTLNNNCGIIPEHWMSQIVVITITWFILESLFFYKQGYVSTPNHDHDMLNLFRAGPTCSNWSGLAPVCSNLSGPSVDCSLYSRRAGLSLATAAHIAADSISSIDVLTLKGHTIFGVKCCASHLE